MSTSAPMLELRGISKSFGVVQALADVDFEVRAGEVMALVGDNGAGKSTLIKCIAGIHPADSGEIFFDGVRTAERGLDSERGKYVGRHCQPRDVRGLAVDDHDQICRTHHSEVLEGPRPFAPGDEVGGGDHVAAGAAAVGFPDGDDTIGVAVWQRLQHHGADDAEHGRGRADTEG